MNLDSDRKRLLQRDTLERLSRKFEMTEMVPVYLLHNEDGHEYAIYCVLIRSSQVKRVLSNPADWELKFGEGMPSAVGAIEFKYLRYGVRNGMEPLVINRNFNRSQINYSERVRYNEISEEFRFFHNLYHDRNTDKYLKIDEEGNERVVAVAGQNCIKLRLKEIRQFLAIKSMYLSIQFCHYEFSRHSLEELGLREDKDETNTEPTADGEIGWRRSYYNQLGENYRSFSVLEGKRIVQPLPKSQSGFPGFAQNPNKRYVEFIIGVDGSGDEISHTCDPTKLNDYDGNLDGPHPLISVHFRKQVLDKYYHEPDKYSVEDSMLSCPWWVMEIDNHHDDKVIVLLRHLSSLPYTEQLHWRAHNIQPEGTLSKTYFERNFKGLFTESDRPEHVFKQSYQNLQTSSEKNLGWPFLLPLRRGDEHHLKGLRIPSTEEQCDFDLLILSLAKILVDSLNQEQLKRLISPKHEESLSPKEKDGLKQSIGCLEIALNSCGINGADDRISFLRKLQSLRSTGTAHRKGKNYQKIAKKFGIGSQSLRSVFAAILWHATDVLDFFNFLLRSKQITPKIIKENSLDRGYAILDEMVGFAESDSTDGSVNHDEVIYELDSNL